MKKALLLSLTLAFTTLVLASAALAAEDGATLLEKRCSLCHSADRAKDTKKTSEQWDATVSRMISHGAQLTPAEKQVLVGYLSKTYKP